MVNDKIYILLWFWLLLLLVISCGYLVFRLVTILSPRARMLHLLAFAPRSMLWMMMRCVLYCRVDLFQRS